MNTFRTRAGATRNPADTSISRSMPLIVCRVPAPGQGSKVPSSGSEDLNGSGRVTREARDHRPGKRDVRPWLVERCRAQAPDVEHSSNERTAMPRTTTRRRPGRRHRNSVGVWSHAWLVDEMTFTSEEVRRARGDGRRSPALVHSSSQTCRT
jgi:hypothetical protein